MSVDSITDLDDNQSRLLEALQLSLPAETPSKKEKHRDKRLSLNPIYRQVPRVVDSCCQHLEKYGMCGRNAAVSFKVKKLLNTGKKNSTHEYCSLVIRYGWLNSAFFHIGLQTVGIFRVGSSKKRVRQVGV